MRVAMVASRAENSIRWALAFAALLALICACIGWSAVSPEWLAGSANTSGRPPMDDSMSAILAINLSTILLLFSGILTMGLSSFVGIGLVAGFIGASMRAVTTNLGVVGMLEQSGSYVLFEFVGVGFAGAAGLLPAIAAVRASLRSDDGEVGFVATYFAAIPNALRLLLVSMVLIVVAAALEATL